MRKLMYVTIVTSLMYLTACQDKAVNVEQKINVQQNKTEEIQKESKKSEVNSKELINNLSGDKWNELDRNQKLHMVSYLMAESLAVGKNVEQDYIWFIDEIDKFYDNQSNSSKKLIEAFVTVGLTGGKLQ